MAKTLDVLDLINPDFLSRIIANFFIQWDGYRSVWKKEVQEIRSYVYATDTTYTTNSQLPWSNKTTVPKLCQIRDNLLANYEVTMFPKRKWLDWEASSGDDNDADKTKNIKNYMLWNVEQLSFKETVKLLIQDYIDYGNTFCMPSWVDESTSIDGILKPGFSGSKLVRIDPLDIVFNPTAVSFAETPKIIRSMMSIGEAKEFLNRLTTTPDEKQIAESVFQSCMNIRRTSMSMQASDFTSLNAQYIVDGFGSYWNYLSSNYVELLTFYGDLYDQMNDKFYKNFMITVMDRSHVIFQAQHPFPLAEIPIYKAGWRERQNNLWAMGPLANLVGMQYRVDHIENLKADLFDLTAFPPMKIKGIVGDFDWGPMEKIFVDSDGDVELMTPELNIQQIEMQIQRYTSMMEEMAGSPKEAMGFRTPGEKTAYEVQRLENAAGRIFQNKVEQFEERILEPSLNGMLVYAKQYLSPTTIRIQDSKYNSVDFSTIQASDLAANGRIKPIAARHFAEKAERIQNLNNFAASALYADQAVNVHLSGLKIAQMIESDLGLEDENIVVPFIRIAEAQEAQQFQQASQENTMAAQQAPSGLTPGDSTHPIVPGSPAGAPPMKPGTSAPQTGGPGSQPIQAIGSTTPTH